MLNYAEETRKDIINICWILDRKTAISSNALIILKFNKYGCDSDMQFFISRRQYFKKVSYSKIKKIFQRRLYRLDLLDSWFFEAMNFFMKLRFSFDIYIHVTCSLDVFNVSFKLIKSLNFNSCRIKSYFQNIFILFQ